MTLGTQTSLVRENIIMAVQSVMQTKLRSFLTVLGIVIGVSSVIAMISIISGLGRSIQNQVAALGSGILYVSKFESGFSSDRAKEEKRADLTRKDATAIARLCPSVWMTSPEIKRPTHLEVAGVRSSLVPIFGAEENFASVNERVPETGRFLTEHDVRHRLEVCVLGSKTAELLFPDGEAIGKEVSAEHRSLRVIGILEEKGNFLGQSMDDLIIVPISVAAEIFGMRDEVDYFSVRPWGSDYVEKAEEEVIELLRQRRGVRLDEENDFGVASQASLLELYDKVTRGFYLITVVISSIGLMVGGIGVMNMMLVSVKERTREIGVRAALGARRRDILGQFLTEAILLTSLGGLIGMFLGFAVAGLVQVLGGIPMAVTPLGVLLALGISIGVGLFFGLYPAVRASRLDPIEALRYE